MAARNERHMTEMGAIYWEVEKSVPFYAGTYLSYIYYFTQARLKTYGAATYGDRARRECQGVLETRGGIARIRQRPVRST